MTGQTLRRPSRPVRLGHGLLPDDRAIAWLAAVALAVAAGAFAAIAPLTAVLGAGGIAVGLGLIAAGERSQRWFLVLLAGLLVGYAFFGRAFAYIGVRPLFIGEVVLAVGIWALLRALPRARFSIASAFVFLYMVWGALRTIPYLGEYGIDALRDGVMWEYAAVALIVGTFATGRSAWTIANLYGRLVPVFLVWILVARALSTAGVDLTMPGTSVSLVEFKAGDLGVHLAGIAAFMLAGLYKATRGSRIVPESIVWLLWFPAAAVVATQTRGGMLAMVLAGLTLLLVRPSARWFRAVAIAIAVLVVAIGVNPVVDIGRERAISVTQVLSNVTSVFDETGDETLDGSRRWRLAWWATIIDYTVHGPYFWTGKGFGVNLADDDGFQVGVVNTGSSLRAPHNGHMEILARTGVPGIVLWVLLNAVWLLTMLRALVRARRARHERRVGMLAWLIVLWAAALVNASFDVYLEGPHGGIWFWAVVGLGIALAHEAPERSDLDDTAPERAPRDSLAATL